MRVDMLRSGLLSILLTAGWCEMAEAQEWAGSEKDTLARAAIQGYLSTRESFPFLKCSYTDTLAQARSFEDALAGKFIKPIVSSRLLIMDGKKVMYQDRATSQWSNLPKAELEKKVQKLRESGARHATAPFAPSGYLSDGTYKLRYAPDLNAVNVKTPASEDLGVCATLLRLGDPAETYANGPDFILQQCDAGKFRFWPEGYQMVNGKPVIVVKFGHTIEHAAKFGHKSEQPMRHYSFDPEQGFLPYRIVTYDIRRKSEVYGQECLLQARPCSRGRWFPERSVNITYPQKEGAPFTVRETKVVELDVDHRPDASEFTLEIPAGTFVVDPAQGLTGFQLKQHERINIADLPKLVEMCKKVGDEPRMDTAIPHADHYTWVRWVGWGALALLAAWLPYHFYGRKRLRTAGP